MRALLLKYIISMFSIGEIDSNKKNFFLMWQNMVNSNVAAI
jgi:hypothetical protein